MKKKLVISVILAVTLSIYIGAWTANCLYIEKNYSQGMEKITEKSMYMCDDEEYVYNLKLPDFLEFTGNLCISSKDEEVAFLIWPSIMGKDEYGVQICSVSDNSYEISISVMTDKNGKPLEELSKENLLKLEEYEDEIAHLIEKAGRYL